MCINVLREVETIRYINIKRFSLKNWLMQLWKLARL